MYKIPLINKLNIMKTEIVINQGKAKIVLTAESEFELDLIEKVVDSRIGYDTQTKVLSEYNYQSHSNHRIEINLIEKQK
jgi:hypothetical protein